MIVTIAGVAFEVRPTDDQLGGISIVLAAFDGEVGNGTFPVPDPDNELTVATGRQFLIEEGSTVLSDGFMLDQDRTRETEPQGRVYGFGIMDANALLDGFRIARSRPAETDVARVLAFAALDGPTWDTTWVLVEETVTLPAKKYYGDGGWTSELIPDVVSFTGKTLFLHDLAAGGRCLHYHNLISGHGCGLSISDDPADVDHVTVWEPWSPQRQRTSVDLRNDVKGVDQAGRTSIQTDPTSIAAHDADGLQHQAQPSFETTSQADLNVQTGAFLASQENDLDTWTCDIGPLDEDALALIRVGDIIAVTSAVMGLTASDQRISHMTLTPAIGDGGTAVPDKWMAALEMGAPVRRRRRKASKALVDRVGHTPVPSFDVVPADCQMLTFEDPTVLTEIITDSTPTTFDTMALSMTATPLNEQPGGYMTIEVAYPLTTPVSFASDDVHIRGQFYVPTISDEVRAGPFAFEGGLGGKGNNGNVAISVRIVLYADPAYFGFGVIILEAGAGQGSDFDADWDPTPYERASVVGDTATWDYAGAGYWNYHILIDAANFRANVWLSGTDEPVGFALNGTLTGSTDLDHIGFEVSVTSSGENTGGLFAPPPLLDDFYFFQFDEPRICVGSDPPLIPDPMAFHWTVFGPALPQETPDGATDTFTIPAFPGGGYVPGTLTILVDGIEQATEQTDPEAGTGTLSWEPTEDDLVTMRWLVP